MEAWHMKANKKTLMAVKQFLESEEYWDKKELVEEIARDTMLLNNPEAGGQTVSLDECIINWDSFGICTLDDFVCRYTDLLIAKFCNVLESFVGEDI
jgi:hypothetical protein